MSTSIQPYARFLDEIRLQQHFLPSVILHFDPEARDLRAWFWYVAICSLWGLDCFWNHDPYRPITNAGARVTPSDLMDHQAVYDFRAPSCLCASEFTAERQYTECAMYLAQSGVYSGEYVAGCTFDCCGYLGKTTRHVNLDLKAWFCMLDSVSLERLYTRRGLLLERYPVRGKIALWKKFTDIVNDNSVLLSDTGHPASPLVRFVRNKHPPGRDVGEYSTTNFWKIGRPTSWSVSF